MGGRALIAALLGIMIVSATIFFSITRSSSNLMRNVDAYFSRQVAQNIAQSGVNIALQRLSQDKFWRQGYPLMSMFGGHVSVSIIDTIYKTRPVVKIVSTGVVDYNKPTERRQTSTAFLSRGFLPPAVKAAITTNNPVRTLGGLVVDGRDRTMENVLIAAAGTLGIWTTKSLTQGGNSKIGGTYNQMDYAPSKPANSNVVATWQIYPSGYPGTPDSVLGGASKGFPEGTLKAIAQSRIGGSQYVTNPAALTTPLRGVTYVELPSGSMWQSMNITGTGLLIVHNASKNAGMKNLNCGTFKGLIIADDIVHIHTTIIGGVICLTPAPSEGNCIGNGTGSVLYSSEAILNAIGGAGTPAVGGHGSSSGVVAWWE